MSFPNRRPSSPLHRGFWVPKGKSKMSKTLNNYIGILEDENAVWEKLRTAVTDVARVRRSDPGNPDVCNIYTMHRAFSPEEIMEELARGCRSASMGCIDCKRILLKNMMAELTPIREKAFSLERAEGLRHGRLEKRRKRVQKDGGRDHGRGALGTRSSESSNLGSSVGSNLLAGGISHERQVGSDSDRREG